jgi:histidinol phosphatase-like PHP family hydrolase
MGIKFFICPDAHNKDDFDYVKYGINIARKAGLSKKDVLNSQDNLFAAT